MYKVNSDNRPRRLVSYQGLPKKWQEEFDYISHDCSFDLRFVMYKTEYYDTIDTQRIVIGAYKLGWDMAVTADHPFAKWHRFTSDSFFSGMLFRFSPGGEEVIVGVYYDA